MGRYRSSAAVAAILFLSRAAAAQPLGTQPPPADPAAGTEPTESTTPAEEPPPPVEESPPPRRRRADPPPPLEEPAVDPNRPDGTSVGIGAGYVVPGASLLEPNVASVRFRLPSGLTLEPLLDVHLDRASIDDGPAASDNDQVETTVATAVRLPLVGRGKIDLVLVGSLGLSYSKQANDGPDNDVSSSALGTSWGIGLDYWPKQSWSISATATNPLITYTRTRTEMPGDDRKDSNLFFGAVFDPDIFFMLHMYL